MKPNIKIIEFTGLPGCGKTTLCNSIIESLSDYDFLLSSKFTASNKRKKSIFPPILDVSFRYLISLVYYLLANKVSRKKGMFVYMLNLHAMYSKFMREHRGDSLILLVDQGFVQGLGSMAIGRSFINPHGLTSFLKHWKRFEKNMVLVDCLIPVEESAKRLIERNTLGGEFDKLRGEDLSKVMCSHVRLLHNLKQVLPDHGIHIKTIAIDMQNPIRSNLDILFNNI